MTTPADETAMRGEGTSFAEIKRAIKEGGRALLFLRHAERPRIANEDPSFGASLGLTAEGERTSREMGRLLAGAAQAAGGDVQFAASPLRRTVLTARLVAEGMGFPDAAITEDEAIGNGCAFVEDAHEIWELFRDGKFFEHMCEYMRDGMQRGFAPICAAADAFEEYAFSVFNAKLGVFATHDVYVAAFLHARGAKTDLCKENWPRFLDSAVVIAEPSGKRRYALLRSGLSEGVCGVAEGLPPC